MNFFPKLVLATVRERNELFASPFITQTLRGEISLETYQSFLAETYHLAKHIEPLLVACAARLPGRLDWLRKPISHYSAEQKDRHTRILNDIHHSGGDADAVRNVEAGAATEAMVAYAYDTIACRNPLGVFGVVLVLKGTNMALAFNARAAIQRSLGLADACFSYLDLHRELDRNHKGFHEQLLDPLADPDDQVAVIDCARAMYGLQAEVFRGLPLGQDSAAWLPPARPATVAAARYRL